jgi:hypothetical protein
MKTILKKVAVCFSSKNKQFLINFGGLLFLNDIFRNMKKERIFNFY